MKNPNTCRLKQTVGLEGDEGGVGFTSVLSGQAWEKRHVGAWNQGHGEAVFQTIAIAFQCFLGARNIAGRGSTMVFTYSVKRAVSLIGLL